MGFLDVAFLPPSQASISTTFRNSCGGDESLGTATCLKTVVGGRQGHAPCKGLSLQQSFFLCQLNFEDHTW